MVLGGCYALWLFNRIAYGNLKIQYLKEFSDLNIRELLIFVPLIAGTLLMGVYPEIFLRSYPLKCRYTIGKDVPFLTRFHRLVV